MQTFVLSSIRPPAGVERLKRGSWDGSGVGRKWYSAFLINNISSEHGSYISKSDVRSQDRVKLFYNNELTIRDSAGVHSLTDCDRLAGCRQQQYYNNITAHPSATTRKSDLSLRHISANTSANLKAYLHLLWALAVAVVASAGWCRVVVDFVVYVLAVYVVVDHRVFR